MEDLKKVFAGKLLAIKAVKLQPNDPFTWASGWKSPFYCDNRQTLSYHDDRPRGSAPARQKTVTARSSCIVPSSSWG